MWPTRTWATGSDEKCSNTPQGRCRGPEPLVRTSEWQRPLFDRLPAAACSPGDWQACPAWCLYRTAPHSTFQLTFRVIVPSALILRSWYCLGSAYYSHLDINPLCATALLLWLCSPADWQACPAWCLYRTAPHSTFLLTSRVIVPSALILRSWYCLGSACYSHLDINPLCASALLLWLCSPGHWQACPAWCLYRTAPHSTFQLTSE